jgi:hypothetical protein
MESWKKRKCCEHGRHALQKHPPPPSCVVMHGRRVEGSSLIMISIDHLKEENHNYRNSIWVLLVEKEIKKKLQLSKEYGVCIAIIVLSTRKVPEIRNLKKVSIRVVSLSFEILHFLLKISQGLWGRA